MDSLIPQSPQRDVYSVTRLNREVKGCLETSFGLLWIEAEISNFSKPSSGHWYLTLKDERSQVRCAMFRNRNNLVSVKPQNGERVLVRARLSLYEARGDYQLIIEHMEPAGLGDLQRKFDLLKNKLEQEGLFDLTNKQPLPSMPSQVGIITSATGAAVRDVISVLKRRSPQISVVIYPSSVQGNRAHPEIAEAIELANKRSEVDILLLVRGGGSLEDLWPFNEENVARAISNSKLPIISGVGHETDFTISDFVADLRAPTPSVAAEVISTDQYEIMQNLDRLTHRLSQPLTSTIKLLGSQFKQLSRRLEQLSPTRQLARQHQDLGNALQQLTAAMGNRLGKEKTKLTYLSHRFQANHPNKILNKKNQQVDMLFEKLSRSTQQAIHNRQQKLALSSRTLNALSPLNTLDRGYNIALKDNAAVSSALELRSGDEVKLKFRDGNVTTQVKEVKA